jgi:hypothetical protein
MKIYCVPLLLVTALTGCLDETASVEPAGRATLDRAPVTAAGTDVTATQKKVLVPIPPPDGGPYDTCGVSPCVEGYVDIRIQIDSSCTEGYRTFCVPCGDYPLPWCR